ncbi:ELKS/Rab6-interacting/CAST family member 1-like [Mya arenaria]|uniref:ELKS/Rab6-interacting/CAST family member 1-like n=1 Tax=Mya arenaria TaxID=6604 RepID=UPI0022E70C2F|nr:ELKS/Rab6-interacting/CAST family member 1-like [Mya arenaria]
MFKRKKKSPSAKDISSLTKKSENSNVSSQSYSSLPKSMYSGTADKSGPPAMPPRSVSGSATLNLNLSKSPPTSSLQDLKGANSPLDLPMETFQSITAAYSNLSKGYSPGDMNNLSNTSSKQKLQSRSPYQSPVHSSYSSSSASHKANTRHRSLEKGEYSGLFSGESSIDRQIERLQMMMPADGHSVELNNSSSTMPVSRGGRSSNSSMTYSRERSQEREYPHMGARSLERDHYYHINNNRSRSSDRQDFTSQLHQTQEQFRHFSRDSLILELQSQITDLNKDCAKMQQELDSTKDKLSSTMNSIKTFWSPELKKERSLRKEECAKYSLLNEQFKATQAELKKHVNSIHELESKAQSKSKELPSSVSKADYESLKRNQDDQNKEVKILRKTVDEMELRHETQKQTLAARDESIKKLLEMLQSKGVAIDKIEESQKELEKFRVQKVEDTIKMGDLKRQNENKEAEISDLKERLSQLTDELESAQVQLKQLPSSTHTMQAIMEAKDSRISALEKELGNLEERLHRFGEEGVSSQDGSLKRDILPWKEKALRAELETLKTDLATRDNEIVGLKMKVDTLTNQQTERQHYIDVLKDQIKSKEQQSSMFNADIDDLRERLREKDATIDKKSSHAQTLAMDKRKLELEVAELRDNIEIKERKISVLQRKVDNLEELLSEKEDQLLQIKSQSTTSAESSDSAISAMEESIGEKDRQIERLKEQRDILELEHQQECERLENGSKLLKTQMDSLQLELSDKQTELCELREEVSELKSSRYKADTRLRQLELNICEKDSEISRANQEIEKLKVERNAAKFESAEDQLTDLSKQVEQCQTEMKSAQTEVDRLLELIKDMENEKLEKEAIIKDLQDTINQYKQKFGTLKRQHQKDKQKNAHLLEEARRREEDIGTDAQHLKGTMKEKEGRIEELEEALRESVKITAEREMLLMEQKMQIDDNQNKIEELQSDLEKARACTKEYTSKLSSYVKQLEDKDVKLKRMSADRHKQMEEVFDMKQEALTSAISEKDANIALLEMTSTKKQRNMEEIDKLSREKDHLNNQLKELIQNRTRYLQERSKSHNKRSKSKTPETTRRADERRKSDDQKSSTQTSPSSKDSSDVDTNHVEQT